MNGRLRFRVIPTEDGTALRALIARRLQRAPKEAGQLIKAGGVYVNKLRVRVPRVRVATGERITIYPDADQIERIRLDALRFVHREPAFCVIDKPAGVPAEFTRESCLGTLSEALLRLLGEEGLHRPYVGVVHPIDRRASGLVMFTTRGLTDPNHHRAFVRQPIQRTYRLAIERGSRAPTAPTTVETALVARHDGSLRPPNPDESGVSATTRFTPIGTGCEGPLLECTLVAAQVDQLILHARHGGFPILGDDDASRPLALWCGNMAFEHPLTGAAMHLDAVPPTWASIPASD